MAKRILIVGRIGPTFDHYPTYGPVVASKPVPARWRDQWIAGSQPVGASFIVYSDGRRERKG